jgi:hypothetical protein
LESPIIFNVVLALVVESELWSTCKFLEFLSSESVVASQGLSDVASTYLERSSQKVLMGLISGVEIVLTVVSKFRNPVVILNLEEVVLESHVYFLVLL